MADLLSTRSPEYKARGLNHRTYGEAELLRLMETEPRLLRRPILHYGDELLIGFDPAQWDRVLGHLARGTARAAPAGTQRRAPPRSAASG